MEPNEPADGHGGRVYDQPGVADAYLAGRHQAVWSPNKVMETPAFSDAVGDVAGASVIDLGCGDGAFAAELINAGAGSYLGIDSSTQMLTHAHRHDLGGRVRFENADIAELRLDPQSCDLITARMSLHYIADLEPVLATVAAALVPGGRLVFSVVHPVISSHDNTTDEPRTTWTVDNYFTRGPRPRQWFGHTATWHHRTLEDYTNLVVDAGLRIDRLSECEPQPHLFDSHHDELARRRRVPLMLLIAASKPA